MDSGAARRPCFKSSVQPIVSSDTGLFLLCEGRQAWIPDPVYAAVAPLLDGTHEIEVIFETLADSYPADQVFAALNRLRTNGYLAEDSPGEARSIAAFWEHAGVRPSLARSRLDGTHVSIMKIGDVDADFLTEMLTRQGVQVGSEGDVTVVVTDDYLRPELFGWNARALISKKPWLLAKPVGIETWIGPMFVPGQTACWECLAQRIRGHRKLEDYIARRNGMAVPIGVVPAHIASTQHAALAEATTEITRWIGTAGQSSLLNRVVSTSVITLERTYHDLIRRPQCRSCGSPAANVPCGPVRLYSRPKADASDGGHRAGDQQEVLAQLERHLSPITGIVSTLIAGDRGGRSASHGYLAPTFSADHHFADFRDGLVQEGLRRRSGGKGKNVDQARISALAESVERYCGVFDGTEPRMRASFAQLGNAAIHPNRCMGYSKRQYAERQSHNGTGQKARWVPEPFLEDIEIEWTPLLSLSDEGPRYLPTSFCYYGYETDDPLFARADSNGCAAGSVLEEAVLHGILELIERDAVALWWYNRLRRPAVDLDGIDDLYVAGLVRQYNELRRELWVLDITSDIGVPTFAAISRRVDKQAEDIIYGFGAHLDPGNALVRALTELNQSLEAVPTVIGPDSNRTYRGSRDAVRWWRTVTIAEADYLAPDRQLRPRRLIDFKNLVSGNLKQDLFTCRTLVEARGIEIFVLDQTRPDIGFPVVRVVAPGLRHFWARFGPGRLYDVPLQEGWLINSRNEEEMNPFVIQM